MIRPNGIIPAAHPRPAVSEKSRNRLLLVAAVNGWTVAVSGGLCLVLSLVASFSVAGVLIGVAAAASGLMELTGRGRVKEGRPNAGAWLAGSQLLLFASLFLYAGYQLLWFDPSDLLKGLTAEQQETLSWLYGGRKLEVVIGQFAHAFYAAIMVGTVLYQGGLCLYYIRATGRLFLEPPQEKH